MLDKFPFNQFTFLRELKHGYFTYNAKKDAFIEQIIKAQILYLPGVYLVYKVNQDLSLGELLYAGKAGANQNGLLNNHQLPKRLLATSNLTERYPSINGKRKDLTRDKAWPHMMKHDGIDDIVVFFFYSEIRLDAESGTLKSYPMELERKIYQSVNKPKLKWST